MFDWLKKPKRKPAASAAPPPLEFPRTATAPAASPLERIEPSRAPRAPARARSRRPLGEMWPVFRAINSLLTVVMIGSVLGGAATFWYEAAITAPGPLKQAKSLSIARHEGTREIAQRLETEGIVSSQQLFNLHYIARYVVGFATGKTPSLKAGDYDFQAGASVADVMTVLDEGRSTLVKFTIPEGLTSTKIVERLKAEAGFTGEIAAVPPEGALMPETYKFERGSQRQAVLDSMAADRKKLLDTLWERRAQNLPYKTPDEAVVMASVIQREAGPKDDPRKVAAVFVNRLRQGMRLQSDPTILYGLFGGAVVWDRQIYKAEIGLKTAYNTYQIDGLPAGPICNPGRLALEAALNPAPTADLYFVADGSGGHVYSTNLKDHNTAAANWRKVEKDIRARQSQAAAGAAAAAPTPGTAPAVAPTAPAVPAPAPQAATPAAPAAATAPSAGPTATPVAGSLPTASPTPATVTPEAEPVPVRKPKR